MPMPDKVFDPSLDIDNAMIDAANQAQADWMNNGQPGPVSRVIFLAMLATAQAEGYVHFQPVEDSDYPWPGGL
jgi:hypothetical protein